MKTVKNIFASLIKNQAVLDGRKQPWYATLLVFIIEVVAVWVPILSKGYTTNNAKAFTTANNGEIDMGIKEIILDEEYFSKIMINQDYELDMSGIDSYSANNSIDSDGVNNSIDAELQATNTSPLGVGVYYDNSSSFASNIDGAYDKQTAQPKLATTYVTSNAYTRLGYKFYLDVVKVEVPDSSNGSSDASNLGFIDKNTTSTSSSTSTDATIDSRKIRLMAFYIPDLVVNQDDLSMTYLNHFVYSVILNVVDSNGTATITNAPHSYLIFTKNVIYGAIYPLNTTVSTSSLGSYYGNISDAFKEEYKKDYSALPVSLKNYLYNGSNDTNAAFDSFANLLDIGGRKRNYYQTWIRAAISVGVTAGVVLIAFVVLLLLNRRKASIYRVNTKWYDNIAEAVLMTTSPSIIGLGIGFINPTYGLLAISLSVLCRLFFINNKICPPTETDDKPLYQARS